MDLAACFNATGIRFYEEGRGDDAFEMFHASLQVMLRATGMTTADMDPKTCQLLALHETIHNALVKDKLLRSGMCDSHFAVPSPYCVEQPSPWSTFSLSLSRDSQTTRTGARCAGAENESHPRQPRRIVGISDDEDDPCLYTQPFALSSSWCTGCSHDNYHYVVAIATDLYNMALVLHRGQVMHRLSGCLERAPILYSIAGELLWNSLGYNLLLSKALGMRLSSLYCAIVNNTGYLLRQIGRFDWSQLFFQRLHQFLSFMGPASNVDEEREREAFRLNAVALLRTLTGAAAA